MAGKHRAANWRSWVRNPDEWRVAAQVKGRREQATVLASLVTMYYGNTGIMPDLAFFEAFMEGADTVRSPNG